MAAREILLKENINIEVINARFVKPLDTELFDKMIEKHKLIFTLEDGQKTGGFGSAVLEYINSRNLCVNLQIIGIDDKFIEHGNVKELLYDNRLDAQSIATQIMDRLEK